MKKIIITGIRGFVGTHLKQSIKDWEVTGVSRTGRGKNIISYDEISLELLNKTNTVIHLAGKAHDLKKVKSEQEYYEANTVLTISLFDKFLKSDCKLFIFISSVKAAADNVATILDEEEVPNPVTPYGKTKLAAENYIRSCQLPDDKKIYILRPCMIHGPGAKGNLTLLYKMVKKGIPYPLGVYTNERSFLSVENLCFIIKKIIEIRPLSGIYNVADDETLSTKEIVKIIGEVTNKSLKIYSIPKWIISLGATVGNVLPLPLNTEKLHKLTENYRVSNKKIKNILNIELPVRAEEGMRKTICYLHSASSSL